MSEQAIILCWVTCNVLVYLLILFLSFLFFFFLALQLGDGDFNEARFEPSAWEFYHWIISIDIKRISNDKCYFGLAISKI